MAYKNTNKPYAITELTTENTAVPVRGQEVSYTSFMRPGSITHVANADGTLKQELSYDAWGRLRDPATRVAYAPGTEPALFLGRGYTGHEYLTWFGLINMNARLYDPALGRFLSPDPYVQTPGFTQSYNRYSYCLNNPLVFTDPNGEKLKLWQWGLLDLLAGGTLSLTSATMITTETVTTLANSIGLYFVNSFIDPNHALNTGDIWAGLFKTDSKLSAGDRFLQLVSRFTWELPQTSLGYGAAQGANMFGQVKKVDYYAGATVLQHEHSIGGAFTLGSYIQGGPTIEADPKNGSFQHEYGHYLQSQKFGWTYLGRCAIPSLISAGFDSNSTKWEHDYYDVEQDAYLRALAYWKRRDKNFKYWDYISNPILTTSNLINASWYDLMIFSPRVVGSLYGIYFESSFLGPRKYTKDDFITE